MDARRKFLIFAIAACVIADLAILAGIGLSWVLWENAARVPFLGLQIAMRWLDLFQLVATPVMGVAAWLYFRRKV